MRAALSALTVTAGLLLGGCGDSPTEVEQAGSALAPAHDVPGGGPGGLGVEERAGECVQHSMSDIGEPTAGAPRSRAEAVERAADDEPHLRGLRQDGTDPDLFVKVEDGRRVAAATTRSSPRPGGTMSWYVTEAEFAAPCDYVNPAHLEAVRTVPEGVTPADPELAAPPDPGAGEAERRHRRRAAELAGGPAS